jgi:Flp pilus assembly protein TadD
MTVTEQPPPGAPEQDADRTTERRLSAPADAASGSEPSLGGALEFAAHLLRGEELARDGKLSEAVVEVETAVRLRPDDEKALDLLAYLHFRLEQFERALEVYEVLRRRYPRDASVRLNLGIVYLKLNRPEAARLELDEVVRLNPHNRQAWAYLGLAHERAGDEDLARLAYERGHYPELVARLGRHHPRYTMPAPAFGEPPTAVSEMPQPKRTGAPAFRAVDGGAFSLESATPDGPVIVGPRSAPVRPPPVSAQPPSTPSSSRAPPQPSRPSASRPVAPPVPSPRTTRTASNPVAASASTSNAPSASSAPSAPSAAGAPSAPMAPSTGRPRALAPPRDGVLAPARLVLGGATRAGTWIARLVRSGGVERSLCARADAIRAWAGALDMAPGGTAHRVPESGRVPHGGMLRFDGDGEVALAHPRGGHLLAFELGDETCAARLDVLVAHDARLSREAVSVAVGRGESVPFVQLRGSGAVVLEADEDLSALGVSLQRAVTARADALVAWVGRLQAQPFEAAELGADAKLVRLTGEGAVLLAQR